MTCPSLAAAGVGLVAVVGGVRPPPCTVRPLGRARSRQQHALRCFLSSTRACPELVGPAPPPPCSGAGSVVHRGIPCSARTTRRTAVYVHSSLLLPSTCGSPRRSQSVARRLDVEVASHWRRQVTSRWWRLPGLRAVLRLFQGLRVRHRPAVLRIVTPALQIRRRSGIPDRPRNRTADGLDDAGTAGV